MGAELAGLEGGRNVPPIPFRRPSEPPPHPLVREIRGPLVVWAIIGSVTTITGAIVWNGQQLRALHESVDAALNDMGILRTRVEMIEKRVDEGEEVDKELGEQIIRLKIRVQ
jgi:hypothetical protein